jgi:hypothetical protein
LQIKNVSLPTPGRCAAGIFYGGSEPKLYPVEISPLIGAGQVGATKQASKVKTKRSRLNHQIDRLGAFALLVRFNLERNTLSFGQILQSCPLHGRDVNEHIATAVIGFDKAIATFAIKELDRTSIGHREILPRIAPSAARNSRIGSTGHSRPESFGHRDEPALLPPFRLN